MTTEEVGKLLAAVFRRRAEPTRPAPEDHWRALGSLLGGWTWPPDFFAFHQAVAAFCFEGDLLEVSRVAGSDTILATREVEVEVGGWPGDMVPFLAIGNGDYFCLSRSEGESSRVYFVFHEDRRVEQLHDSFADWLRNLEQYFGW